MKTLAQRGDLHLARRFWHMGWVLAMFVIAYHFSRPIALRTAVYCMIFFVSLDLLRLRYEGLNRRLVALFSPFLRESERSKPAGSTSMLIGITLSFYLFPRPAFLLTLLFFALADPIAAFVGTRYGKDRLIGSKTLQGTLAAFVVCVLITIGYCVVFQLMVDRLSLVALLGGLIGALSELIPVANLDDNFIFPVLSSALLTVVLILFGGI